MSVVGHILLTGEEELGEADMSEVVLPCPFTFDLISKGLPCPRQLLMTKVLGLFCDLY